jgi:HSP20 family protein
MANESQELEKVDTRPRRTVRYLVPCADVIEHGDSFLVLADIPGVDETGVDIQVERNVLTLRATVVPPQMDGLNLMYKEYEPAGYERQFTLSDEVDTNRIDATVKNGVLSIRLGKAERARPRKINVSAD